MPLHTGTCTYRYDAREPTSKPKPSCWLTAAQPPAVLGRARQGSPVAKASYCRRKQGHEKLGAPSSKGKPPMLLSDSALQFSASDARARSRSNSKDSTTGRPSFTPRLSLKDPNQDNDPRTSDFFDSHDAPMPDPFASSYDKNLSSICEGSSCNSVDFLPPPVQPFILAPID